MRSERREEFPCPCAQDPQDVESDEIVLDVELGGYRYLLIRTPKSSRTHVELSPREKEIVRMVAQGHPNKIIADVLNISSWTVCTHLRRVFAKLGVGSRAAMVARMHDLGTIRSGTTRAIAQAASTTSSIDAVREKVDKSSEAPPKLQNFPPIHRQSA